MTSVHGEYEAVIAIANKLWDRSPRAWSELLIVARRENVTLLALVYRRLRDVRDAAARVAFERQTTIAEVAREWLALTRRTQMSAMSVAGSADSAQLRETTPGGGGNGEEWRS